MTVVGRFVKLGGFKCLNGKPEKLLTGSPKMRDVLPERPYPAIGGECPEPGNGERARSPAPAVPYGAVKDEMSTNDIGCS